MTDDYAIDTFLARAFFHYRDTYKPKNYTVEGMPKWHQDFRAVFQFHLSIDDGKPELGWALLPVSISKTGTVFVINCAGGISTGRIDTSKGSTELLEDDSGAQYELAVDATAKSIGYEVDNLAGEIEARRLLGR